MCLLLLVSHRADLYLTLSRDIIAQLCRLQDFLHDVRDIHDTKYHISQICKNIILSHQIVKTNPSYAVFQKILCFPHGY